MLRTFLVNEREAILRRSRGKLTVRQGPRRNPSEVELSDGLPLFLDQIIAILGRVDHAEEGQVSTSAEIHGEVLLGMGLEIGEVVHEYGSICQSVTELADEQNVEISAREFHIFNGCLDEAIAQAVTAYQEHRDKDTSAGGSITTTVLATLVHEMGNLVMSSLLTFKALSGGAVGVHGHTGRLHGRTLERMRLLIDRSVAELRLEAGVQSPKLIAVAELIEELELVHALKANDKEIQVLVDPGDREAKVVADHQLLASALTNLFNNAVKFTRPRGQVSVRAHCDSVQVFIAVTDECGGLPSGDAEDLFLPFVQRSGDRSGLGLGLSITRKCIRAAGGDVHVRDTPGTGCTFTIALPRARGLNTADVPVVP